MKYIRYVFCTALALFSCGEKKARAEDENARPRITADIYADPSFTNITQELTDVYESFNDSVDFQVVSLPEELAIKKLLNDSAQSIVVSRPLNTSETAGLDSSHQKSSHEYLIAQDAVAFVVNKSDKDSLLSQSTILEILTKNTKGKMIVFDANYSSSINFVNQMLGADALSTGSFATKNTQELLEFVSNNKNSIGILGSNIFSNMEDSTFRAQFEKIKLVGVKVDNKAYYPFQADIAAKKYPFSRNIYIINSEHYYGKYSGFKNFVTGPKGQRLILKSGLMPVDMPSRLLNFVKRRESQP